ncbi:LysR family transcriptional regulator [Burkholderiaceae bacterium DAT-1]|nr:LysR family transcriptional regulator [Burkholderiaceae bacterium DAT-1]
MLDDLALFVHIVDAGSLRAAAVKLDIPSATVTRRLQALEVRLQTQLLHRSARRLVPTQAGRQYYEACRDLVTRLEQVAGDLEGNLNALAGEICVLAPVNLANGPFKRYWASFMAEYPDIRLNLQLSNHREDVLDAGADLAIRVGPLADSSFGQRRLASMPVRLVASPDYLARFGTPATPAELMNHRLIVADPLRTWHFQHPSGENAEIHVEHPVFVANEMQVAIALAEAGQGLLYIPQTQLKDSFAGNRLVVVLPDWDAGRRTVYAVWPHGRALPARVRRLIEHLVRCAEANGWLSKH